MNRIKPMLLYRENPDTSKLPYPVFVTPKLDGMRAVKHDNGLRSRTLKPIPNVHAQEYFKSDALNGADGELICGAPNGPAVLSESTSLFRSESKPLPNEWGYYLFDWQDDSNKPYEMRYDEMRYFVEMEKIPHLYVVPHEKVANEAELLAYEQRMLAAGYEGIVIRCRGGKYLESRTTLKQNNTFKLKRFTDTEGIIVGFFEEQENTNAAEVDEYLGNTKRSKAKAGLIGKGTLGGFLVQVDGFGGPQRVGSGFTKAQREQFWQIRHKLVKDKAHAKVKYFNHNIKDEARHMIFLEIRDMELDG